MDRNTVNITRTEQQIVKQESEPDYDTEMRLSLGKTCDDCAHSRRCFAFGFSKAGRTSCDFWPSRWSPPPQEADQ